MELNKERVVSFIRERGDEERAAKAESELPETITLPKDEGLLAEYGVLADDIDDEGVWGGKSNSSID